MTIGALSILQNDISEIELLKTDLKSLCLENKNLKQQLEAERSDS